MYMMNLCLQHASAEMGHCQEIHNLHMYYEELVP